MSDWGLRISKPGKSVFGSDQDMAFSSKFDNFKIHSQGSGTIYDSTGRTVTIAHNLGYVPAFLVHTTPEIFNWMYQYKPNSYCIAPQDSYPGPGVIPPYKQNREVLSWADTTNLYIKLNDNFGWKYAFTNLEQNNYATEGTVYITGYNGVGKDTGGVTFKGATRFNNVQVSGSVYKADFGIYLYSAGAYTTQVRTWGIREGDTGDFGGNPFGRSRTTNVITSARDSGLQEGATWYYGVTSLFNEILSLGSWSSGNHMAFVYEDNGSPNDSLIYAYSPSDSDSAGYSRTALKWLVSNTLATYKYTIFKNKIN